jgi:hypothetical protein
MFRIVLRRLATAATAVPRGAVAVEPVKGGPRALARAVAPEPPTESCGTLPAADDDLADPVSNVDPKTGEWGGPTKGGAMPEPTRFGDWERKGRCSAWRQVEGWAQRFLRFRADPKLTLQLHTQPPAPTSPHAADF